jgi:lysozyme
LRPELLASVVENEGFRSKPYQDTLGVWTIGHGLTFITVDEAIGIVKDRLNALQVRLHDSRPWLKDHPVEVLEILTEMAYQLGFAGLLKFSCMWKALEEKDYINAANEMLDSKWAEQTPERATRMAKHMAGLANG